MLQNKFLFNQSGVSLEIIGLPDYSNNENNDYISIISQWKLTITDKPLIEGTLDHLNNIMDAFYNYSSCLLNEEIACYESKLIDIKTENYFTHDVVLKSTKPDVKPLNFKIGNSVLSDIISCFDQLRFSNKVKKIYTKEHNYIRKKGYLYSLDKDKFSRLLLPPFISLFSLFFISTGYIYFYNATQERDNKTSLNYKTKLISIKSRNTIL